MSFAQAFGPPFGRLLALRKQGVGKETMFSTLLSRGRLTAGL
jgi:hypothetical protein